MSKFFYKVIAKITREDDSHTEYYELKAKDTSSFTLVHPETMYVELTGVKVGDVLSLSFDKVNDNSQLKPLYFLHHFDRKNQGDVLSGPYNYFEFDDFEKMSWDNEILEGSPIERKAGGTVIIGGGIYFTNTKPRLDRLIAKSKNYIGWGIGLDPRTNLKEYISKFTLLGTRERKSPFINNKNVFYVPCSSCMHDYFDKYLNEDVRETFNKKIAIHLNHGFNEKLISNKFKDFQITYTTDPFEKTIQNISSAEYVITNSYHGAYWGSLMGRKVICLTTNVPKWEGLHDGIVQTSLKFISESLEKAKPIPLEYLIECRKLNQEFYQKIKNIL